MKRILPLMAATVGLALLAAGPLDCASSEALRLGALPERVMLPGLGVELDLSAAEVRVKRGWSDLEVAGLSLTSLDSKVRAELGRIRLPLLSALGAAHRGRAPEELSVRGAVLRVYLEPEDHAPPEAQPAEPGARLAVVLTALAELIADLPPEAQPLGRVRLEDATLEIARADRPSAPRTAPHAASLEPSVAPSEPPVFRAQGLSLEVWRDGADVRAAAFGAGPWAGVRAAMRITPGTGAAQIEILADGAPLPPSLEGFGLGPTLLSGVATVRLAPGAPRAEVALELFTGPVTLALEDAAPVPLDGVELEAALAEDGSVEVARLAAADGILALEGGGAGHIGPAGPELDLELGVAPVALGAVVDRWPETLAPEARAWVQEHVRHAGIHDLELRVEVLPPPHAPGPLRVDGALSFGFADAELHLDPALPAVTAARGHGRISRTGGLRIELAGSAGPLAGRGSFALPLSGDPGDGPPRLVAELSGELAEVVAAEEARPLLERARAHGVALEGLTGRAELEVVTTFSQGTARRPRLTAKLSRVALPGAGGRLDLSDGALELEVSAARTALTGEVAIAGVRTRVFGEVLPGEAPRFTLSGRLDARGREALELPEWRWLDGPMEVSAEGRITGPDQVSARVRADLTPTSLRVPALEWRKPAGAPALLSFAVEHRAASTFISELRYRGGGLELDGEALLDGHHGLKSARLTRVRHGVSKLGVEVARSGSGYHLAIAGDRLDLRGVVSRLRPSREAHASREAVTSSELTVSLSAREVFATDGLRLEQVRGAARLSAGHLSSLDAEGQLGGGQRVALEVRTRGAVRAVRAAAEDMGAFASALGIVHNLRDGLMRLDGVIRDDRPGAPFEGTARVSDFRVLEAPTVARVFQVGSLRGILDLIRGKGVRFDTAEVPFTFTGSRLQLGKARATGPALGLTAEGFLDTERGQARITGTIVPLYSLNSFIGKIPILGRLLVPKHEGLFGPTYSITGSVERPRVKVNAFASLLPGFLRRLFFPPAR